MSPSSDVCDDKLVARGHIRHEYKRSKKVDIRNLNAQENLESSSSSGAYCMDNGELAQKSLQSNVSSSRYQIRHHLSPLIVHDS